MSSESSSSLSTVSEEVPVSKRLNDAIYEQDWDLAGRLFKENPDECKKRYNNAYRRGWTKLHWLCNIGTTPSSLIDLVASIYPDAISIQDTYTRDTCIHIICRNSHFSAINKLRILLKYCNNNNETILIRNSVGHTALHSAARHNANIKIFKVLLETNINVLHIRSHNGIHAITALWSSFIQTIPGHKVVVSILNGETNIEGNNLFEQFWFKCQYLAVQYCKQSYLKNITIPVENNIDIEFYNQYILHCLLQCNVPIDFMKVCLRYQPLSASVPDDKGNLPLHLLLINRPYQLNEREAIQDCLLAYPQAALHCNATEKLLPLEIAIQKKIPYENGIDLLIEYNPLSISHRDVKKTNLYPFQLAALQQGENVSINTTYKLLLHQPDLVIK